MTFYFIGALKPWMAVYSSIHPPEYIWKVFFLSLCPQSNGNSMFYWFSWHLHNLPFSNLTSQIC